MFCTECGYLHAPYSVEDVQTEGFMQKFIDMCKHEKLEIPEWIKENKWLNV